MILTSLPRTSLNVDGKTYNVCSVICHTTIDKKNRICSLDAMHFISRQERFPCGGKDIYVIILEEEKIGDIITKTLSLTPCKKLLSKKET